MQSVDTGNTHWTDENLALQKEKNMAETTEPPKWGTNMDALEENWRAIITESQDEYKREYADVYGLTPERESVAPGSS